MPLDYNLVIEFESAITNCSHRIPLLEIVDVPPGERYLDSTLVSAKSIRFFILMIMIMIRMHELCSSNFLQPVVSKELILNCESVSKRMQSKFGENSRYPHEIIKTGKNEIFEMLTSNVSLTVQLLDEIRKSPKYVSKISCACHACYMVYFLFLLHRNRFIIYALLLSGSLFV